MIKESQQGAVRILAVEGALNEEEGGRLCESVAACPAGGRPQLVLDLSDTPLIDSAGCEALLDTRDAVVGVGGAAHLAGLSPLCLDVLAATGLNRYFQSYEGVQQAVAQFAR